jgi:hypothetical protein
LIDENTSKYAQLSQSGIAHVGGVHVFQVLVAKDESPTSQFSVRLFYSVDEVSTTSGMSLSVDTGSIVNKWDTNVIERAAEDLGDKWLFWFAVDLTGAGDVTVQVFPAHDDTSGNASSANVGSQVCTAVDLHYGRYPQSYIKTEATSVTLAGETLQIDAPVLARAIGSPGPELVDTTWINDDPNTLVADGDQLTLTRQIGASEGVATSNTETLTANETYLLSIPILSVTNNFPVGVYHGTTQIAQSDEAGTLEVFYTPDTTTTNTFTLRLRGSNAVQSSAVIKQPSLRKVTMPAAVSIAIEGYMTYADLDAFRTVVPLSWEKSSDDKISFDLGTNGSNTGRMFFVVKEGGVSVGTTTPADDKTPGVNVPFNYAMRATGTQLRAASDGTLTVQDVLSGIPDLIASDFEIAPTFNGNITSLTIWADDITDPGIQAATTEGSGFNPLCPL